MLTAHQLVASVGRVSGVGVLVAPPSRAAKFLGVKRQLLAAYSVGYQAQIVESSKHWPSCYGLHRFIKSEYQHKQLCRLCCRTQLALGF